MIGYKQCDLMSVSMGEKIKRLIQVLGVSEAVSMVCSVSSWD